MPIRTITVEQKRPLDATPERALSMYEAGVRQDEMALMWHVTRSRVSALICKARRAREAAGRQGRNE